jgi:hypothetical protein
LEESSLPTILQYIHRWSSSQKDKLSMAIGLLMAQGLASASCLQSLTKDHLLKNGISHLLVSQHLPDLVLDVSLNVITLIFRAYLVDQSVDHLAAALKKGGIKDLLAFFPLSARDGNAFEEHFRKEGLPQLADWWAKKQSGVVKEEIIRELKEMCEQEEPTDKVSSKFLPNCGCP